MTLNYKLHFSVTDFRLLLLDQIFHSDHYGAFDYYSLTENNITYAYLSQKGRKDSYEFSKSMLDSRYYNKIYNRLIRFNNKLEKYVPIKISKISALDAFHNSSRMLYELCSLYLYLEEPFQQAAEEQLAHKFKNQDRLNDVLTNPKKADGYGLNKIESHCLNSLVKLGRMKLRLHEKSAMLLNDFNGLAKYLAKQKSISVNQALTLRRAEFVECLKGGAPDITLINKRLKGFILLKIKNKWLCLSGKEYRTWKRKIEKTQSAEIKGQTAYKGNAKGKVIIFQSWTESIKIPKGSVFVTGMTNPQMVPFLKNAVAIVTDEGGLTCHAAIISRELKIPCIVGTGNATRVLKDGDMVEVDTEKGVVKIEK